MKAARIDTVELLRAVEQATEEWEAWLAAIGTGSCDGVHETPHRSSGKGVPCAEVAQVFFHGMTGNGWWRQQMLDFGIRSFTQISWSEGHRLQKAWWPKRPVETQSEQMLVSHALRRASVEGLVVRGDEQRKHETATWIITQEGDALLRAEDDEEKEIPYRRVRMQLDGDAYMDTNLSPDASPETVAALRAIGNAAAKMMREQQCE